MTLLDTLKALLEKETDPAKRAEIEKEIVKAIEADAKTKAEAAVKADMDKQSLELAQAKSMLAGMGAQVAAQTPAAGEQRSGIQVGTPGLYKGFKLKAEMARMSEYRPNDLPGKAALRAAWRQTPERAEALAKCFIDGILLASPNFGPLARFKAGMNEGTTTAGGFLTPNEQSDEWSSYVREESIALMDCRLERMLSDVKLVNKEDAVASVAITAEATDATETNPTVAQTTLTAKRIDGYTRVTNEDLEDAIVRGGFVNQLLDQFAEAIGQKIDSCVFVGTGDPVSGVFLSAGVSQVFSSGSTNFSALLEADIRGIIAKIRPSRRGQARWYIQSTPYWTYLKGLKDTTGRPIFQQSLVEGAPDMVYGKPVREMLSTVAPGTSAAATGFIVYGDLRGFMIGVRSNALSFFVDPYTRGLSHETIFAIFNRYAFAHHLNGYYGRIVTAAT